MWLLAYVGFMYQKYHQTDWKSKITWSQSLSYFNMDPNMLTWDSPKPGSLTCTCWRMVQWGEEPKEIKSKLAFQKQQLIAYCPGLLRRNKKLQSNPTFSIRCTYTCMHAGLHAEDNHCQTRTSLRSVPWPGIWEPAHPHYWLSSSCWVHGGW